MENKRHLAVIFSDWHINNYKRFNKDGERLRLCIKPLFDIAKFCTKAGIKTIIFTGDLYDTHKALYTEVVNATVAAFVEFSEKYPDLTIYAISGNHDHSTKNLLDKPATSALKHIESICHNFVLIDDDRVDIGDDIILHGIPYYEYKEHYRTQLEKASGTAKATQGFNHFLLIHQTPDGIGNEMIPTDTNPADELYKPFKHVWCGHIHKRQYITDKFTLVGNPIHRDAADAGKKKGFLVMNLLNPDNGFVFKELTGYPKFIEAYVDEVVQDEDSNYVIRKPRVEDLELFDEVATEDFTTSLTDVELLTNYWTEVDGKDEALLKLGLGFLNTIDDESSKIH